MRERKTAARSPIFGGLFAGLVKTDPGGLPTVEPFAGAAPGSVFTPDDGGTFQPIEDVIEDAGGILGVHFKPLTAGGEPMEILSNGGGSVLMVPWDPEG